MRHLRTLITTMCVALLGSVHAQNVPCPGETLTFQLAGEYYGTKTWEFSNDGITWTTVNVIEDVPFVLQPEQSGWYRVRFHDEACDIDYMSEAQRFVAPAIDLGDAITISIGGVVKNELGFPVFGATVRAGCGEGVSTTTDGFGVFLLQGVTTYEKLASVTVEKDGYFRGSRSFVPADDADEAVSQVYIVLLEKNLAGTVQGPSGVQAALEGVSIIFPPNGFAQNGQPFSGPVRVYVNHIDPTSDVLHDEMPGALMGVLDGEPQLMLSFGMAAVELTDTMGQAVQLAAGSLATVRFPVLAAQQSTAPATIPLWWFDAGLGYWVQEGEAQRVGNQYIGQVSHFSWWNCDVPSNFVELKGVVFGSLDGGGLAGARIVVVSQSMGDGTTYTNSEGEFTGLVPLGEQLTLQVQVPDCGPAGPWITVHEEVVGPFTQVEVITLSVTLPGQRVIGLVVDCDGLPVASGYARVDGITHFCTNGAFQTLTCATSVTVRGVNLVSGNASDVSTIVLVGDTTDIGELLTCTPLFGTVTDVEGNSYQTVHIGAQEWMASNLRTGHYRDGTVIPNVTLPTGINGWTNLTAGAWCNYDNDPANDALYGKLYPWYAAANPNICPLGWHVPTDAEWMTLETTLGMPAGELNVTGNRGAAQNVGGRMKATALWNSPNTGATNETEFSGLPGGTRSAIQGAAFLGLEDVGVWWSASEYDITFAWFRSLGNSSGVIHRDNELKWNGYCIRCLRD